MGQLTWAIHYLPDSDSGRVDQEAEERRNKVAACSHSWMLDLEHPEDGGSVHLHCHLCSAGIDDMYPDGHDMLYLTVDDVDVVEAGRSLLDCMARVPVSLDIKSYRHSTPNGDEWDVEIVMEALGPIERFES